MSNIIKTQYYLKRDNTGRIRFASLQIIQTFVVPETYQIVGETGLLEGKKVPRPVITIDKGKVKRDALEQTMLQYNHEEELYLNKGYKNIEALGIDVDYFVTDALLTFPIPSEYLATLEPLVPIVNTDANGARKPMLAKSYKDIPDKKSHIYNDHYWFASRKLDGVRCFIWMDGNGELRTSSRGGKDYDIPASHILLNPNVKNLFVAWPDLILDGELYIHGRPLSYISGLCRKKEFTEKHKELVFNVYDIVDEGRIFTERNDEMNYLRQFVNPDNDNVVFVDQYAVWGWDNIIKTHDKFVDEGYEGLVIRHPDEVYKCGARDERMIKIKMFDDDEFVIKGLSEGLREEDMCFVMETKEGWEFMAKPMGDRALKKWYREHINELIGKKGTVKYFHYTTTEHPVPNLPVFKCVRDIKDMDL